MLAARFLVDAHIVDEEFLRKNRFIDRPAPAAAQGEVDQKVVGLAEWIILALTSLVDEDGSVFLTVEKHIDSVWVPLKGINVEIIIRLRGFDLASVGLVFAINGVMQGAVNVAWLFPDKLHDVDLTAGWPTDP